MPSKLITAALLVISATIFNLFFAKQLTLYIHPRYVTFTVVFIALCFSILLIDIFTAKQQKLPRTTVLIVLLAFVGVALPPRSLSPQLAANRTETSGSFTVNQQTTVDAFSTDFTHADIRDWVSYLRSNPPVDTVVGKKATVEGFIYAVDAQLFIARYQLTCCAVDATPLSLALSVSEVQRKELTEGQWVRAEGSMVARPESDHPLQLEPTVLLPIAEPRNPYVF